MEVGLVSVVVPIYKTEKYLDRCISSIVNQTYQKLEILLIDDGSPDNCPQMCEKWAQKDKRMRVIHKENQGLGMARNTGIQNATGEYICFFDSDDYVELDTIEKAYIMAKAENADVVLFGMCSVNRYGQITKNSIPLATKKCYSGKDVQTLVLPDLIDCNHDKVKIKGLSLSACTCLFSMVLVRKIGWQFMSERKLISEDSYALIWLHKHVNKVAILSEALYFYCENEASLTHVYREDRYEKIKQFYQATLELADQLGYSGAVHKSISGVFVSFSIAAMKQILASNLKHIEKRRLLSQIVNDDCLQRGLSDIACRRYGLARRVLFWTLRHKQHLMVFVLVKLQTMRQS